MILLSDTPVILTLKKNVILHHIIFPRRNVEILKYSGGNTSSNVHFMTEVREKQIIIKSLGESGHYKRREKDAAIYTL